MDKKRILSSIPKVDELLNIKEINELQQKMPRLLVIGAIRDALGEVREKILNTPEDHIDGKEVNIDRIVKSIRSKAMKGNKRHLKKVINATGVIIHTNLGRSVLSDEALEAVIEAAKNYSNLEYDLDKGERGSRYSHVEDILAKITGAQSAIVVNNNAAAVLLVLSTLCRGREAIVSRGELVEIGGSFRIPDVMEQSGARLVEVGTTNKTHLYDYEKAINENTGVLMKVHTSNYRILGFTESVSSRDLAELGIKNNIPVIEDIGSGSFIDLSKYGIEYEPTVQEAVNSGVDIVTFSGDKMLGGPQAGLIAGKKEYIDLIKKNQLTRALRVDKMTIAALEATLKSYIDEEAAVKSIPTLRMITASKDNLRREASKLARMLRDSAKGMAKVEVMQEYSQIGGGAMPLEYLPTFVVSIKPFDISVSALEEKLRGADVPVIVRIFRDSILLDVRTIKKEDYSIIRGELLTILQEGKI